MNVGGDSRTFFLKGNTYFYFTSPSRRRVDCDKYVFVHVFVSFLMNVHREKFTIVSTIKLMELSLKNWNVTFYSKWYRSDKAGRYSLILQIIQLLRVNDFPTNRIKEKAQTSNGNPNFVRQDFANGYRQKLLH